MARGLTTLGVLVLAIAFGTHLATARQIDQMAARQIVLEAELARLADRLDRAPTGFAAQQPNELLRADLGRLAEQLRQLQAAAPGWEAAVPAQQAASQPEFALPSANPRRTADDELLEQELADGAQDTVVGRFDLETIDGTWGADAENALSSALYDQFPGTQLTPAECRSTVCKVAVRFDEPKTAMEYAAQLPFLLPWPAQSHVSMRGDGTADVYVARIGYSLEGSRTETSGH